MTKSFFRLTVRCGDSIQTISTTYSSFDSVIIDAKYYHKNYQDSCITEHTSEAWINTWEVFANKPFELAKVK